METVKGLIEAGDTIYISYNFQSFMIFVSFARYQRAGDHPKTVSNGRISPMI